MSPSLNIALLGQLEVVQTPGTNEPVNQSVLSTKEQALFAYLLITGNQYTREHLTGLFWGNDPDDKARNSLRVALSHIRKLDKECIVKGNGHRVAFNPAVVHSLDLTEFNQIVRANASTDLTAEPVNIDRALVLYRGDLLAGLHINDAPQFQAWLDIERAHHRDNFLRLLERQTAHLLNSREFGQAHTLLKRRLRLEPWNESAHQQLMMTLCRLGDFNGALTQYELCRELLDTELDVAPMPETQQLRERILAARNGLRHNLPAEMKPFVGRPTETSDLIDLLVHSSQRLITIVGLGGIGKTRLALHAARRLLKGQTVEFMNGLFFVSLVAVRSTDQLLALISKTLNPNLSVVSSNLTQVLDQLRHKEMLLILDDWESFIHSLRKFKGGQAADATELIHTFLQHCPDLKILVTSREPLGLFAEKRFELQGLDIPPVEANSIEQYSAVRLFAQVGQQVGSNFQITDANREPIIQICKKLDGMPLGIELAATWLSVMSCQRIADEIQKLDFLDTEIQGVSEHQRSLRAIFDQSWQMMTHAERDLFRHLAVFAGTFSEDAACAVASTTLRELMALMERSLLHRTFFQNEIDIGSTIEEDGGAQQSSITNDELPIYYSLHSIMRQFAREKLAESKEVQFVMRQEHCSYYVKFMQEQQSKLFTEEHHKALALIAHDRQNVLSAWAWAMDNMLFEELEVMLDASEEFFLIAGFFEEAELTMRRSVEYLYAELEKSEEPDPRSQHILGKCLAAQARFQLELSQFESAKFTAEQLYVLSENNNEHLATALRYQGAANYRLGHTSQARSEIERSLMLAQDNSLVQLVADNLQKLGAIYNDSADYQQARSYWQQGLEVRRTLNDQFGEIGLLNNLGVIAIQQGDYKQAHMYYQDAYRLCKTTGDRRRIGLILNNLGRIYAEQRDFTRAMRDINESLAIARSLNSKLGESNALLSLGRNYMFLGQYGRAQELHQQALEIKRSIGEKYGEVETLTYLALIYCLNDSPLPALEHISQAGAILEQSDFSFLNAQMLTVRSHILIHQEYMPEAQQAAQQAFDAWLTLGNVNLSIESLADLARIELALKNNGKALEHVEKILAHIETGDLDGVNFPLHTYLICYDILVALNDPRAKNVLADAFNLLNHWANAIEDEGLKQSYMDINHHRRIIELSITQREPLTV